MTNHISALYKDRQATYTDLIMYFVRKKVNIIHLALNVDYVTPNEPQMLESILHFHGSTILIHQMLTLDRVALEIYSRSNVKELLNIIEENVALSERKIK